MARTYGFPLMDQGQMLEAIESAQRIQELIQRQPSGELANDFSSIDTELSDLEPTEILIAIAYLQGTNECRAYNPRVNEDGTITESFNTQPVFVALREALAKSLRKKLPQPSKTWFLKDYHELTAAAGAGTWIDMLVTQNVYSSYLDVLQGESSE